MWMDARMDSCPWRAGAHQQSLVHGRQPAQLDPQIGARAGQAQRGERLVVEGRPAQRRAQRLAAAHASKLLGDRQAPLRQPPRALYPVLPR